MPRSCTRLFDGYFCYVTVVDGEPQAAEKIASFLSDAADLAEELGLEDCSTATRGTYTE